MKGYRTDISYTQSAESTKIYDSSLFNQAQEQVNNTNEAIGQFLDGYCKVNIVISIYVFLVQKN